MMITFDFNLLQKTDTCLFAENTPEVGRDKCKNAKSQNLI